MRVGNQLVVTVVLVGSALLSLSAGAAHMKTKAVKECSHVSLELREMEKAQGILLESMVKKNDSLAGTLDHYADDLSSHDQKSKKGDIVGMRKSAEAFRGHSDRELMLIAKFQKKSQELIEKTSRCLAQNSLSSKELRQSNTALR